MKINWKIVSILFIVFFVSLSFASASEQDNQTMNISNDDIISVDDTSNYKSFIELQRTIDGAKDEDTIILNDSYINDVQTQVFTLNINKPITLNGNGVTLDGNNIDRIMNINANNVVLKNLIFKNGKSTNTGAISWSGNNGIIDNCIFENNIATDNTAGAIYWTGNGGTINNSTFKYNTASNSAGAVRIEGNNFLISNNKFENNEATHNIGGGMYIIGNLQNITGNIFISNFANSSGGGFRVEGNNSIITNNIFDKNIAKVNLGGAMISLGNNTYIANNKYTNNIAGRDGGAIDIEGYVTEIKSTSGFGNTIIDNEFKNNSARYGGSISINCRLSSIIGNKFDDNYASELGGAIRWVGVIDTTGSVINNTFNNNYADISGGALYTVGNKSTVTGNTFINHKSTNKNDKTGGSGGSLTIHGNEQIVADNNFINSNATNNGGAIYAYGNNVNISNNKFENTVSQGTGGSIYMEGSSAIIANNNFDNAQTKSNGGAIRLIGNNSKVSDNTIKNTKAEGSGGAIYQNGDSITITKNTFEKSSANRESGGAITSHGNNNKINDNIFSNNKANTVGGAIYSEGESSTITDNKFNENTAGTSGGAIHSSGDNSKIENNEFNKNTASEKLGGAISSEGKKLTLNNNKFIGNTAKLNGGAAYIKGNDATITNNNFNANIADNTGGALRVESGDNTIIKDNEFNKNIAKANGGAINIDGAKPSITENKFYENEAQNEKLGGAIWFKGDNANIESNTFKGNTARTGTAINGETSSTKVTKNTFLNSLETDKTLIRLVGDNNDVKDNIYTTINSTVKLTMNDITVYYGGTEKLIATLTDSASKPLANKKVIINFKNKNNELTTDSKGQVSIDVKDLNFGTYKATATFAGDDDYDKGSTTATITSKSTIESKDLTAEVGKVKYNGTFIDSNGKPLSKGEYVSFIVENDVYRTQVGNNGVATTTINKGVGEYIITSFNTVTGESTENKLKITKVSSTITMNNVIFYYSKGEKLNIALIDKNSKPLAKKDIVLTINGKNTKLSTDKNGKAEYLVSEMDVGEKFGTYNATVKFAGDTDYGASQATATVTYKTTIISTDLTAQYGNVIYNATFLSEKGIPLIKGTEVTFSIDNNDFKGTIGDNGVATATINLGSGDYNIKSYNPTTGESATNKLKITKISPKLNVKTNDISEGENAIFDITTDAKATGDVTLTINKEDYKGTLANGKAKITVSNLTANKYPYTVKYAENKNYSAQSVTGTLNVKSDSVIINAPDVSKYYGGSERLTVKLSDKNGTHLAEKHVYITINGIEYEKTTNTKGETSIGLNLPSANYTATIVFKGDADYKAANTTNNIEIKTTIFGTDIAKIEKAPEPYSATCLDKTGKVAAKGTETIFNINGVFYTRQTKENGIVRLNLNLEKGTYIITATNTATGESTSNTITIKSRFANAKDVTKFYRNDTQYFITLLDNNGKPVKAGENVTFNINGVFYTRQTNENGTAKLNINLQPDTYIITAEYKGCKASNTIKVLPVLSAKDITMKYRDGTQFVANLVNGEGKPLANESIIFNINGVFYNRITDINGAARLNINLMAGEYIITSNYNDANIANKITINT